MSSSLLSDSMHVIQETFHDPATNSNSEIFLTGHATFDWKIDFQLKSIDCIVVFDMITVDVEREHDVLNLDIKDLDVSKVLFNNLETKWIIKDGTYPNLGNVLTIDVPNKIDKKFTLMIVYKTRPQSGALQWLETEMTADKIRPFLFTQCQAIHARSLFPCQDTPQIKFTYSARVHAPKGATVIMSARSEPILAESNSIDDRLDTYHFTQNIPIPSYLVALACGELTSSRIGTRSHVWSEPSLAVRAMHEFGGVDTMLAAAEDICGPYEWGIYDILVLPPSFPYGGMENPCLTFVSPCLLAGDRSLVAVIAHEITHSWTGNLVTNASWEHFWLNEGHTKYVEGLILEAVFGSDFRELHLELGYEELQTCLTEFGDDHEFTKLCPKLTGVHPDTSFSVVPYEKGSMLLYFLEQKYGKDKMLAWLKAYVVKFRKSSLDTPTWLQFLATQLGPNVLKDLDWNTWLYSPGPLPWKPTFNRNLSQICDYVVDKIIKETLGSNQEAAAFVHSSYNAMIPLQRELVFQRLRFNLPLSHGNIQVLDRMLEISHSQNAEIRYLWSLICLHSQYLPGLDSALEFLNGQGRMKYTRPIYRALMSWPAIKQQAINNFKAQRPSMHPTTAKLVETDIGLA